MESKIHYFHTTKELVDVEDGIRELIDLLHTFKSYLKDGLDYSVGVTDVKSVFFRDYDFEVSFEFSDKEERYTIGLFALEFKKSRVYPLHICFDDYMIKCNSYSETKQKLDELFQNEWKETLA